MNKKLIAAAIAAVVAAPSAFADAVVYGKMHTSIDANDFENTVPGSGISKKDNYEMNSRSSRLGFKGSEDLGNGMKAIYQIEFGISSDQGGNISGRNTFVGLSGGWGTFLMGKHDTPAKVAFYAAGTEVLGDSILDLNKRAGIDDRHYGTAPVGVFHELRADNAVAYISPSFGGLTFAGAFIPGEQASGDASDLVDHYSLAAMYKGNGLKASVGYVDYELYDTTVLQAGASFTFGAFMIGGHYEMTDDLGNVLGGSGTDYDAYAVTAKFTFGNNAIAGVYTDSEADGGTFTNYETTGWGLSAEHNFSKRTKLYAAYASNNTETSSTDEDDDVMSLGMIHSF